MGSQQILIDIAYWAPRPGDVGHSTASVTTTILKTGKVPTPDKASSDKDTFIALTPLICGIIDMYQASHQPQLLKTPVMLELMARWRDHQLSGVEWLDVSGSYIHALGEIARHVPIIASELAAKAAERADSLEFKAVRDGFFARAMEFWRQAGHSDPPPTLVHLHERITGKPLKAQKQSREGMRDYRENLPTLEERLAGIKTRPR